MLGLSTTTVSNVIHGKTKEVSAATIARVEEILQEYKYVPNINARNLAQNESKIIGLAMKSRSDKYENFIKDPFTSELIGSIERALRDTGYFIMIYTADDVEEIMQKVSSWNVDGLLLLGMLRDDVSTLEEMNKKPMVCIDSYFMEEFNDFVNVGLEDEQGAYEMTKYLLQCGHKKIAFLADNRIGVDQVRYEGYKRAMEEAGIPVRDEDFFMYHPAQKERETSMKELCKRSAAYTAVFCASDYYAITFMNRLLELGKKVPDDISVVGFDDNLLAQMHRPALTTVHQDVEMKGEMAVRELIRMIRGKKAKYNRILLPTELKIRDTVKILK